ncbi:hypothetical protein DD237_002839 [Peronospora effusa]|uniref:tRNA (guanine(9)-N(1))-methyltransferase n=1 Tax=Peronospora effusa TaxID=542832 RepID=A0A3R8CXR0_9STRA|nr:hypothetical protein DD237_002839 [Peronospora effusa]
MRSTIVAISVMIMTICGVLGMYYSNRKPQYVAKSSKQSRREMLQLKRRNRKNERLKRKKSARRQTLSIELAKMTQEQKKEQRERICMQRVEQYQKLEQAQIKGLRVVVDLAFAVDQTIRERHSIFKQLGCAYGYLKVCPLDQLLSLQLVSCTHELASICALRGVLSWKSNSSASADHNLLVTCEWIGRHEEPLEQLYDARELVYLSPDSETVLTELDPACVYVVGGIVDRSVRKGQTKTKAASHGIRTACLPLQEHIGTRVRTHIMNLDSVIIALNEVANHGDWVRAFKRAVPPRIVRRKGRHTK